MIAPRVENTMGVSHAWHAHTERRSGRARSQRLPWSPPSALVERCSGVGRDGQQRSFAASGALRRSAVHLQGHRRRGSQLEHERAPGRGHRRQSSRAQRARRQHGLAALLHRRRQDRVHRMDGERARQRAVRDDADAIKAGDPVHLRIRARFGTPLATLLTEPTRMVNDFAAAQKVAGSMFVFDGRALAVDTTAKTVTVDVRTRELVRAERDARPAEHRDVPLRRRDALPLLDQARAAQLRSREIKVGDPITLRTRARLRDAAREPARSAALEGQRPRAALLDRRRRRQLPLGG